MFIINDIWKKIKKFLFKSKFHIDYDIFVKKYNKIIYFTNNNWYINKANISNKLNKNIFYSIFLNKEKIIYESWPMTKQIRFIKQKKKLYI